jgi:hypothetical protein
MAMFFDFVADDAGAVTIDWVALTAGILLLAIAVMFAIHNNGVSHLVSDINSTLDRTSTIVVLPPVDNING